MFAIVVQTLIPFVVAADIAAKTASAIPICSVVHTQDLAGGSHRPSHHDGGGTCPICAALAAATAITTPAPVAVPLPRQTAATVPITISETAPDIFLPPSYRSRAPPIA